MLNFISDFNHRPLSEPTVKNELQVKTQLGSFLDAQLESTLQIVKKRKIR